MFKASSEFARASDEAKSALLAALTRRTYANNEVVYLQVRAQQLLRLRPYACPCMDDGLILYAILRLATASRARHLDGGVHCDMARIGNVVGSAFLCGFGSERFPNLQKCTPAGRAALPVVHR
jgi:hypothetical protein